MYSPQGINKGHIVLQVTPKTLAAWNLLQMYGPLLMISVLSHSVDDIKPMSTRPFDGHSVNGWVVWWCGVVGWDGGVG